MPKTSVPANCASCADNVGHGPECSSCKSRYHFSCAGISERGYDRLGTGKATWICSTCRDKQAKPSADLDATWTSTSESKSGGKTGQGAAKEDLLVQMAQQMDTILQKLNSITSIEADIKQLRNDITVLNGNLNKSIEELSHRVSEVENRVTEVEQLRCEVNDLKKTVADLTDDNSRNEQWVRKSNIQINGVHQKNGENLIAIITRLADHCHFPLKADTDIDFITRVATKNDNDKRPKLIIVKFQARYKKDDFLAAIRKVKGIKGSDIGFVGVEDRIYANDHLSAKNRYLLQQAKAKSKDKNYAFCWVRNCTAMVRRNEKSPIIHVTLTEVLKKIT
ncbi:hypothetical protein JYU34_003412 [Plutella xylostella]|uniref:Zinc finger PHD-type domain-containing protein n=1 Tax=Plutella xylostella TaxID=51655 RepID=A0ABQ7R026_PLUXY|nr:hypothetical protein JYU34_003412 [Plutella xylostella]